jgi:hypothetical protein
MLQQSSTSHSAVEIPVRNRGVLEHNFPFRFEAMPGVMRKDRLIQTLQSYLDRSL